MSYTLDTNVLVYAADSRSDLHQPARRLRDQAASDAARVALCFPVLLEFYAVVTDPKRVRKPLSPKEAWQETTRYRRAFRLLRPSADTWEVLSDLVTRHRVRRQDIFDALLVALMVQHKIRVLYTANTRDFARYKEIETRSL